MPGSTSRAAERDRHQSQELRLGQAAGRRLDHHAAGHQELPAHQRTLDRRKIKEAILALRIKRRSPRTASSSSTSTRSISGKELRRRRGGPQLFQQIPGRTLGCRGGLSRRLAKAPNNYSMTKYPEAAKERRDWSFRACWKTVISARRKRPRPRRWRWCRRRAAARSDSRRLLRRGSARELVQRFGEDGLYKKGLTVKATVDPHLQELADKVLHKHLVSYDRTQGYRGPSTTPTASMTGKRASPSSAPFPGYTTGRRRWCSTSRKARPGSVSSMAMKD